MDNGIPAVRIPSPNGRGFITQDELKKISCKGCGSQEFTAHIVRFLTQHRLRPEWTFNVDIPFNRCDKCKEIVNNFGVPCNKDGTPKIIEGEA